MSNIWKRWQTITKKIASIQANIVLFVVYYLFIVPFGFFLRFFLPKLLLGHRYQKKKQSFWIAYTKTKYDMSFAKKQ